MVNQTIKDVQEANKKLRILRQKILNKKVMDLLAKKVRSIIWKRTKAGFGSANGKKFKLAPLQDSTVDIREGNGIMRTFKTAGGKKAVFIEGPDGRPDNEGKFFKSTRSNLTFSGQMLDSITWTSFGFGFTVFIPKTSRKPYGSHDVLNRASIPNNQEVAIFVQKGRTSPTNSVPRPFFELTKGEVSIIIKFYNDIIKREIRRLKL